MSFFLKQMLNLSFILQSKLGRLPAYLTIQMVRFFYKEKESVNAKVLKVGLRKLREMIQGE